MHIYPQINTLDQNTVTCISRQRGKPLTITVNSRWNKTGTSNTIHIYLLRKLDKEDGRCSKEVKRRIGQKAISRRNLLCVVP